MFKKDVSKSLITKLIITTIVLLAVALAVFCAKNENSFIRKIQLSLRAQTVQEMSTFLNQKLQEIKTQRGDYATLEDVTNLWLQENFEGYNARLIDDITFAGKKIELTSNGTIATFTIDENLTIENTEQENENEIRVFYEIKDKEQDKAYALVTIQDKGNGIEKVEFLNEGFTLKAYGKESICRDCKITLGEQYNIKVTSKSGEQKTKTILISNEIYYRIIRDLEDGVKLDNKAIKIKANQQYTANVILDNADTRIKLFDVKMGENTITPSGNTVNISQVTDDINIKVTKRYLITNIEFEKQNVYIKYNSTVQLNPKITPSNADNKVLTWTSSDTSIATVNNNGLVSSSGKQGSVTITCVATDENHKSATCTVHINFSEIWTSEDLYAINTNLSGNYVLMADIDLSENTQYRIIGNYSTRFSGILDGNGHTIRNHYWNSGDWGDAVHAFVSGLTGNGTITRVNFENYYYSSRGYNTGVICYSLQNNAKITECKVTNGTLANGGAAAGIAMGAYNSSVIENCYVSGMTFNNGGNKFGILGDNGGIEIRNCYFYGTLNGSNAYPIIKPTSSHTMSSCYYNANNTNMTSNDYGTYLTNTQFSNKSNFVGWDFENTWIIKNGKPELRCFLSSEEIAELEALPENQ